LDASAAKREYQDYLESVTPRCQAVLDEVAEGVAKERPAAVHVFCDGGKDRTGVFVALAQRRGRACMDDIVSEFILSNARLPQPDREVIEEAEPQVGEVGKLLVEVHPAALVAVLESLSAVGDGS
jgi:protein tyrosine/serine phosphatase